MRKKNKNRTRSMSDERITFESKQNEERRPKSNCERPTSQGVFRVAMCQSCINGSEDFQKCVHCKQSIASNPTVVELTWTVTAKIIHNFKSSKTITGCSKNEKPEINQTDDSTPSFLKKILIEEHRKLETKQVSTTDRSTSTSDITYSNAVTPINKCWKSAIESKDFKSLLEQKEELNTTIEASLDTQDTGISTNRVRRRKPTTPHKIQETFKESSDLRIQCDNLLKSKQNLTITNVIENMTLSSSLTSPVAVIDCQSIRVGDYKCLVPPNTIILFKVVFSNKGIIFHVPHAKLTSSVDVTCALDRESISSISVHFSNRFPVVFIAATPKYAAYIRRRLGLDDNSSPNNYFCSLTGGMYIVFVPIRFTERDATVLKQIFGDALQVLDYEL